VLSAYKDNAAVIEGWPGERCFCRSRAPASIAPAIEPVHILMKVETHNHPTAIAPDPGAATGAGGEIRDEGATGRGAKPKAGLCGFSVSNLRIPGFEQPWEQGQDWGRPGRIVSALDIMLEGPIGAAAFNNEFGRPNLPAGSAPSSSGAGAPTASRNCAATTSRSCSPAARQHPRRSTSRRPRSRPARRWWCSAARRC
jgi:phosphoribosylformylglycinamidine (FGAM) synthase-like enzyme